jgi:hypothetical protein
VAVIGTYCEICGLPVQLDHYVPSPAGGLWIWREGADYCEPVIAFGPGHAWLSRAVALCLDQALPAMPMAGTVHDGVLYLGGRDREAGNGVSVSVFPGIDDWIAAHYACWQLAGRPGSWHPRADVPGPEGLEEYQQQLFEFRQFIDDGHEWMLADPDTDTPDGRLSRQRILDLLRPRPRW